MTFTRESQQYDSFGQGAGSTRTRYGYTGRERDAETNLYFYRARWYDPQAGRFISEDPIGLDGGINLFAYVENNPINLVDPSGLSPSLGKCVDKCSSEQAGVHTAVGAALLASGLPLVPKRFTTPGSSPATSLASSTLSRLLPQKLSRGVWAPTFLHPFAKSNVLGRVIGRWIPYVGAAILAYDGVKIGICVEKCMKGGCQ